MPTSLSKYLDPTGLDETVVNIRQLAEALEAEMQELPYARPDGEVSATPVLTVAEPVNMSTELARIWAAIQSLGYTRNAAQLSRPVSLADIGSIDETQKDTTDIVEIGTSKEVQE